MSIGTFFKKLFGISELDAGRASLKQMEAEGIITGNLDDIELAEGTSFHTIDENTPDYYGSWDPNDVEEFSRRVDDINQSEQQGPEVLKATLAKYGCSSYDDYSRIQDTFIKHGFLKGDGAKNDFIQAQMNVALENQKQELANALSPELLEPVNGVSLEIYATIMAKRTQLGNSQEGHKLLAQYDLDEATFNAVDEGWQARMRQESDGAYALLTEYGKYYAAAGQGQHGSVAAASAQGIGVDGKGGQISGAPTEPCTFDKYVEILSAGNVWSQQGRDVNAMNKQVFQIDANDWSSMSAYWSQKFMSDFSLIEQMTALQEKYEAQYRAGVSSPDDDLSF